MMWKTIQRPGYLGKKRNEMYARWNEQYGDGNWKIAWQLRELILEKSEALQIYEDGYYEFFKNNSKVLEWLVATASDVYDTASTNIQSKFNYEMQETINNHIHDIAIRRAVLRNGIWFSGDKLLQIRGNQSEGAELVPYKIPFHMPQFILAGEIKDYGNKGCWWKELGIENSIEEFYQQNKILQVRV